jgi:IstB-like ATP binding protein
VKRKPGALRTGTPFTELLDSFKQLQDILLRRLGGDRGMADILVLVLFHTEQQVEHAVTQALAAGKSGRIAHCLTHIDLVILDELGYLSFSQACGALLFHLINGLYEKDQSCNHNQSGVC